MSEIELVVFDMAGTTIHDDDGVNRAVRSALEAVGVSVSRDAVNEVMGIPKPAALRHLLETSNRLDLLPQLEAIHTDFVRRMIEFYRTDPSVKEIPGAAEAFRRLRAAGIKTALDTGFSRNIVAVLLERLGWEDRSLLNTTITSDEVPRGRPFPDMIQKAMRELGITEPRKVAKVGDTPSDLEEGLSAGCGMVVGVTRGSHTEAQLKPYPHTHLIGTVAELPALLGLN